MAHDRRTQEHLAWATIFSAVAWIAALAMVLLARLQTANMESFKSRSNSNIGVGSYCCVCSKVVIAATVSASSTALAAL